MTDLTRQIWLLADAAFQATEPVAAPSRDADARLLDLTATPPPRRRLPRLAGLVAAVVVAVVVGAVALAVVDRDRADTTVAGQAGSDLLPLPSYLPAGLPAPEVFRHTVVFEAPETYMVFGRQAGDTVVDIVSVAVLPEEPLVGNFGERVAVELADGRTVTAQRDTAGALVLAAYQRGDAWVQVVVPSGNEALIPVVDRAVQIGAGPTATVDSEALPAGYGLIGDGPIVRPEGTALEIVSMFWPAPEDWQPAGDPPVAHALSIDVHVGDDQSVAHTIAVVGAADGLTPVRIGSHDGWRADPEHTLTWSEGDAVVAVRGSLAAEELARVAAGVELVDEQRWRTAFPGTEIQAPSPPERGSDAGP